MSFTTLIFLIFFATAIVINLIVQRFNNHKLSLVTTLIFNYVFYCYWDYRFSILLLVMTLITYYCSLNINKKSYYLVGLLTPIITLCFFKYFNFFLDTLNLRTLNIVLPIGISFYTFEAIAYIVDVKRKKIEAEKDLLTYATFLSFFPNIISGPIERASNLLNQFKEKRTITLTNIEIGIQIMAIGYFKKMVIADRLAIFVDDVYRTPNAFNSLTILLAVLSYSIQIYMDFSGYSDIAIGVAKCLGYDLKKNFNLPYISNSVTEFWRRWHISLSSWFKDYVYISLGGNRNGRIRTYINLLIVMSLSGLWHGSNWTYVIWGLLNGVLLCIEKPILNKLKDNKAINLLRIIFTYLLISITWIFFRAETISDAFVIIRNMFMFKQGINQPYIYSYIFIGLLMIITLVVYINNKDKSNIEAYYPIQDLSTIKGLSLFFIFVGLILVLAYANSNPFVYFQF